MTDELPPEEPVERRGGRREGSGRKLYELTPARLKKIAKVAADFGTLTEAASEMGVSTTTIAQALTRAGTNWTDFAAENRARGLLRLRRAQFKTAIGTDKIAGNPTMQIWLGKQLLDQKDKTEVGFDKDKPVVFRLAMGKQIEKDRDDDEEDDGEETKP